MVEQPRSLSSVNTETFGYQFLPELKLACYYTSFRSRGEFFMLDLGTIGGLLV